MSSVNHPAHYQGKHECIDEMVALFGVEDVKAFCRCNVYKYRYRAIQKGGQEDIDKADWYTRKLRRVWNRAQLGTGCLPERTPSGLSISFWHWLR